MGKRAMTSSFAAFLDLSSAQDVAPPVLYAEYMTAYTVYAAAYGTYNA
jgi:hypothetical protein